MNQTFDFQRFLLMLRLEIAEKGRTQFLMAALLVVLLLLMFLPIAFASKFVPYFTGMQIIALFLVLLLGGSLYTGQVFDQYGPRDTGMSALMIPASRLEKFMSTLLLNLLFIVPFLLLFLFLHSWSVDFVNARLPEGSLKFGKVPPEVISYAITFYAVSQGVFFLGSLYFTKAAYIKTAVIFTVLCIAAVLFNQELARYFTNSPAYVSAHPFGGLTVGVGEVQMVHEVVFSQPTQKLISLLPFLILIALWCITFVRLKEKEI